MSVEERLEKIEARNARVEEDKAWETSLTRRLFVAVTTYVVIALVFMQIHPESAWIDAVIPTCGYLLSTLTLGPLKSYWAKKRQP